MNHTPVTTIAGTDYNTTARVEQPAKVRLTIYIIRCKAPDMKRAMLMRPDGYMTRLRVHAARIPDERLEGYLAELREMNPDWTFEAVST